LRPIGVYAADHVHRYVPLPPAHLTPPQVQLNEETLLYWRSARCVFSTTPVTTYDDISFAGVSAARTMQLPNLIDPVAGAHASPRPPGDYILWVTNTSPHKNHTRALEALKIYWTELGGNLDVVICGSLTETLKPGSGGAHALTVGLEGGVGWSHRVRFAGHVDDQAFAELVAGSAFLWHNVITDNGTFVAMDAARADRHFVSSDYPTLRYLAGHYGFDATWFSASDPRDTARALIETEHKVRAGQAPRHALKPDDPAERSQAYQRMIDRLLDS
jgi:glycosyltransferase involved in cell wall biosynthesis